MSYDATLFPVLIAGPSDVEAELDEVTTAMTVWNGRHGDRVGIRMDPRNWRSHGSPEMGSDPQDILNRQVGDKCDAIIVVFGARLGTGTPRAISGTAEEIERFRAAGKRVMIYFSRGDIPRAGFSAAQFQALEELKHALRSKGLLGDYTSVPDLRKQIDAHLSDLGYFFRDSLRSTQERPRLSPVRAALNLEIAANHRTLQRLWGEINRPPVLLDPRVASPDLLPPLRLTQQDSAHWRRSVFEQQLPGIVEALGSEELGRVDLFYDRLAQFDYYRGALRPFYSFTDTYNFPPAGLQAWEALRRIAEDILTDGHPLEAVFDGPADDAVAKDEPGYLDHQVARIEGLSEIASSTERMARLQRAMLERIRQYPTLEVSDDPGFLARKLAHLSGIADLILQFLAAMRVEKGESDKALDRLVVASRGVIEKSPFANRAALAQAWGQTAGLSAAREAIDQGLASVREQRDLFSKNKGAVQDLDRAIRTWEKILDQFAESHEAKRAIVDSLERAYTDRLNSLAS